jgi:carbonic anhydrase
MACASGRGLHAMRFVAWMVVWACAGANGATLCDIGRRQSPIDIRPGTTARQALPPLNFDYHTPRP